MDAETQTPEAIADHLASKVTRRGIGHPEHTRAKAALLDGGLREAVENLECIKAGEYGGTELDQLEFASRDAESALAALGGQNDG